MLEVSVSRVQDVDSLLANNGGRYREHHVFGYPPSTVVLFVCVAGALGVEATGIQVCALLYRHDETFRYEKGRAHKIPRQYGIVYKNFQGREGSGLRRVDDFETLRIPPPAMERCPSTVVGWISANIG